MGRLRGLGNWAVFEAVLTAGPHRLELPSLETPADPEADYLYFAAVVSREAAATYLSLGGASSADAERR